MKYVCVITGCGRPSVPAHAHCKPHLDDLYRRLTLGADGFLTIRRLPEYDPKPPVAA